MLLANKGASLLQLKRMEDFASVLKSIINGKVCSVDLLWLLSSRQRDVCCITRHNLAMAKEALSGGEVAQDVYDKKLVGGVTKALDKVAQWNAEVASSASDLGLGKDNKSNVASSSLKEEEGDDDSSPKVEDSTGEESKASSSSATAEPNVTTSHAAALAKAKTEVKTKEEEMDGSKSNAAALRGQERCGIQQADKGGEQHAPNPPCRTPLQH